MSHRDKSEPTPRLNAGLLRVAVLWLFRGLNWSSIRWRTDCTWSPRLLAVTALVWAWSDESNLGTRFTAARRIAAVLFPPQGKIAGSYQAFIKLLVRWTPGLVQLIQAALRARMQADLAAVWRVGGRLLFGMDGSKVELPRTASNQAAYAPSWRKKAKKRKYRRRQRRQRRSDAGLKKADTPQLLMTTLWHVGSGLPWSWRIGGSYQSEREQIRQMLPEVPAGAVLAGDAGLVGYDFIRTTQAGGRHVLVRVGSNVRLLTQLGSAWEHDGIVYLWPTKAQKKSTPPLVLRLVVCHNGQHPVYLVTTLLDCDDVPDRDVIAMYRQRWGIEVYHRSLKQTFQRRKLRSHSAAATRVELEWSLVGLWAMSLYAVVQIRRDNQSPRRLSCAKLLEAFRRTLRDYLHPVCCGATLCDRLRKAVIDPYQRQNKTSRDYPRKKKETPPGPPTIIRANAQEITLAKTLRTQTTIWLTA
jgi:DDE family transposase